MFVPTEEDPDLVVDEVLFRLDDTLDFDAPVTAYDYLCAVEGRAVAMAPGMDGVVLYGDADTYAYLEELRCVICNPDAASLERLRDLAGRGWTGVEVMERLPIQVDGDGELMLFNSSAHGGLVRDGQEQSIAVNLGAGRHEIECSHVGAAAVFRFVRSEG